MYCEFNVSERQGEREREREREREAEMEEKERVRNKERRGGEREREIASPRCIFLVLSILTGLGRAIRRSE